MTTRVIKSESDLALLVQYLRARPRPYTVDVVKGAKRSAEQNRLAMLWIKEAAEQLGDRTFEELRGECKLRFGVPILRAANEGFREKYDRLIRPLTYQEKLELMVEPFDFPVTRLMKTSELTAYLDALSKHFLEQGIVLTNPEERRAA
jgi:hypothetical protein